MIRHLARALGNLEIVRISNITSARVEKPPPIRYSWDLSNISDARQFLLLGYKEQARPIRSCLMFLF